jgi:hypothetical protein
MRRTASKCFYSNDLGFGPFTRFPRCQRVEGRVLWITDGQAILIQLLPE